MDPTHDQLCVKLYTTITVSFSMSEYRSVGGCVLCRIRRQWTQGFVSCITSSSASSSDRVDSRGPLRQPRVATSHDDEP